MRHHGSGDPAGHLRGNVTQRIARRQFAFQGKDQRYRGIEMRARDRPENGNENHKDRAGRKRIAEQRQRDILGQGFGHDAGADHGRDQ